MKKNIKISIILAFVGAIAVGANIYKNSLIADKIETKLKNNQKVQNDISFDNVSCSGLININCSINNVKIIADESGGIEIDKIVFNDIKQWEIFASIDQTDDKQMTKLLLESIKNGAKLGVDIENLNFYSTADRETMIDDMIDELSNDTHSQKVAKDVVVLFEKKGIDISMKADFSSSQLLIENTITTALIDSKFTGTFLYDINDKQDINKILENIVFKELNLNIKDHTDTTMAVLFLYYKQLVYSEAYSDKASIRNLNKNYSLAKGTKDINYLKFKELLKSDITAQLIDTKVQQLNQLKKLFPNKEIYVLIDSLATKIKRLSKGDDELSIIIKSELSANIVDEEFRNILSKGKTSKPLNELFTLEIK